MNFHSTPDMQQAFAQLIQQLHEALSNFVEATTVQTTHGRTADLVANDDRAPELTTRGDDDIIGLRSILLEFGFNQQEVATLRKCCGFPAPLGPTRPIMFRRAEVDRWVRSQRAPTSLQL